MLFHSVSNASRPSNCYTWFADAFLLSATDCQYIQKEWNRMSEHSFFYHSTLSGTAGSLLKESMRKSKQNFFLSVTELDPAGWSNLDGCFQIYRFKLYDSWSSLQICSEWLYLRIKIWETIIFFFWINVINKESLSQYSLGQPFLKLIQSKNAAVTMPGEMMKKQTSAHWSI